jgi:hypothetical protein
MMSIYLYHDIITCIYRYHDIMISIYLALYLPRRHLRRHRRPRQVGLSHCTQGDMIHKI